MLTADTITDEQTTSYPVAGSDGHAYLCGWTDGRLGWIAERTTAMATDAALIVQRCMKRGTRYGSEWTVRNIAETRGAL